MKITLVSHRYDIPLDDPCIYPLGFMYVSSLFKLMGHEVKVLNYNLWDYDFEGEIKDADLVCFTGFEEFRERILSDEKICVDKGIQTMVGGALATFNGIPDFQGLQITGEFPGSDDEFYNNVYPDYEGFGIEEYHKRHAIKYMGVLSSFGCPYSCTFCAQTCEFMMRDLDSVFKEIDFYIDKYKCEMIVFNDNTLNINKKRFLKICDGMKDRGISWGASVRCVPLDEEMVVAAKISGCEYFVVGVESFSQKKLDMMNKKMKVENVAKALDLLEKYDIDYHGNVLVGFEDESIEDIFHELSLIPMNYKVFPTFVQPFIGTGHGVERGISEEEYDKFDNVFLYNIQNSGKYCYPKL